jgi:hypothetical protein
MTSDGDDRPRPRASLFGRLKRVNAEVSQWAASLSWWRLIVLFLVILIAGSMIGDRLHLKHDRVRVAGPHNEMAVTIGGRNGIRITTVPPTPAPPMAGASADSGVSGNGAPPKPPTTEPSDNGVAVGTVGAVEDEDRPVTRQVMTVRGVLGDLGGVVLVVLFAYLAAAKIVVRKVAQADAKVRTALDAAEKEAMERQLVQARLQVLQAQVEPHFLFNTLAAVDYLIETEPPRASRMQKALITYLRGALPQMRQQSSTLGREIKLVSSYLELIKMRIEERLEVEFAIPHGLAGAEFPPMVLQSLVENAVKHGIEPKPQGGKVSVAAGVQGTQLWVEVRDAGFSLLGGELLEGSTSGTGLGLQNIRERLAMLYSAKSQLTLRSDAGTGTTVRISIPYLVRPEADESEASQVAPGTAA